MKLFEYGFPVTDLQMLKSMNTEDVRAAGLDVEDIEKGLVMDMEKAAKSAGLVQKEITVRGKNGNFYQKKAWVHKNESATGSGKKINPKAASAEQSKKAKAAAEKHKANKAAKEKEKKKKKKED